MRRYTVLLSLVFMTSLEGCSLIFTKGPPVGHEQMNYFSCTEGNAAPIIDLVIGGLDLISGFAIAGNPEDYGYTEDEGQQFIVLGIIQAGVLTGSAIVGFNRVKKCRAAKAALAERLAHGAAAATAGAAAAPPGTAIDSVNIDPATATVKVGEMLQLKAVAYGGSRPLAPQPAFRWSSSKDAIGWVTPSGLVSALAPGTIVVAANAGGVVGTTTIVVNPAP